MKTQRAAQLALDRFRDPYTQRDVISTYSIFQPITKRIENHVITESYFKPRIFSSLVLKDGVERLGVDEESLTRKLSRIEFFDSPSGNRQLSRIHRT